MITNDVIFNCIVRSRFISTVLMSFSWYISSERNPSRLNGRLLQKRLEQLTIVSGKGYKLRSSQISDHIFPRLRSHGVRLATFFRWVSASSLPISRDWSVRRIRGSILASRLIIHRWELDFVIFLLEILSAVIFLSIRFFLRKKYVTWLSCERTDYPEKMMDPRYLVPSLIFFVSLAVMYRCRLERELILIFDGEK